MGCNPSINGEYVSYYTGKGQESLAPIVLLELEVGMKFQTTCRGDLAKTKWVCGSACFPYGNLYKKLGEG